MNRTNHKAGIFFAVIVSLFGLFCCYATVLDMHYKITTKEDGIRFFENRLSRASSRTDAAVPVGRAGPGYYNDAKDIIEIRNERTWVIILKGLCVIVIVIFTTGVLSALTYITIAES